MARTQTSGKCLFCQQTYKKGSMTRHFPKCLAAHQNATGGRFFHVIVTGGPDYWLHLAVPVTATLKQLDEFLRDKWLECCGHLSAFRIGETFYETETEWSEGESMKVKADKVLKPALQFTHEYDFGSTTELDLKVAGVYEGASSKKIKLLAENDAPLIPCSECGQPSVNFCTECLYEDTGCLCEEHSQDHECGDDMFLPVVNSPRAGVCGYGA